MFKLDNSSSSQTGWMDFNTTKKIGWNYYLSQVNNNGNIDKKGIFRIDESQIDGLKNDWTSNNNIIYYEKISVNKK